MKLLKKLYFKGAPKEKAMALVLTLAILVIVTGLILAFFTRATSERQTEGDRSQRKLAETLAQSGGQYVIGQILQEISNSNDSTTTSSNGFVTYEPKAAKYMIPQSFVNISGTGFPLLVRQSGASSQAGVAADPNASGDSTTVPAANGRMIPASRWDEPALNFGSFAVSGSLPTWVYVTTGTVSGTAASGASTVGRFAYNVYNVSGLLNANAAGYSSSTSGTLGSLKSTVAGADLTQLGLSQSTVDSLVTFRNPQAATSGSLYSSLTATSDTSGYLTTLSGSFNNNYFSSRQDLLRYAQEYNPSIKPALPYLTTFSASANAPSWKPSLSGASVGSGGYTANDDVLTMRWANNNTITHYDDNGNPTTYTVNAGDPLIQHRFSLAKLAWINHSGTCTSTTGVPISAAAIQACFGLVWNPSATGPYGSTMPRWEYAALSTSGTTSSIMRLDQVAALTGTAAREPNFFELLKAGILWGSLGRDPGPFPNQTVYLTGTIQIRDGVGGYGFDGWSASRDMQILQIGVNLIDQTTSGNYPNLIFGGHGTNTIITTPTSGMDAYLSPQLELIQTVAGVKDLPYLYGLTEYNAWTDAQHHFAGYVQPSIWDPMHSTGQAQPSAIRVNTYGQGYQLWNYYWDTLWLMKTATSAVTGTYFGPQTTSTGLVWLSSTGAAWLTGTSPKPGPWNYPFWCGGQYNTNAGTGSKTPSTTSYTGASATAITLGRTGNITEAQVIAASQAGPLPLDSFNSTYPNLPNSFLIGLAYNRPANGNCAATKYVWTSTNAVSTYSDGGYPVGVYFAGDTTDAAPICYDDPYFKMTGTYTLATDDGNPGPLVGQRTTGGIWGGIAAYDSGVSPVGLTFTLEYQDGTVWKPYSCISKWTNVGQGDMLNSPGVPNANLTGTAVVSGTNFTPANLAANYPNWATPRYTAVENLPTWFHVDPRTDRFSISSDVYRLTSNNNIQAAGLTFSPRPSLTGTFFNSNWPWPADTGSCANPGGFKYKLFQPGNNPALWVYYNNVLSDFFRNIPEDGITSYASYSDPDLITRPADGALANLSTGDGCPIYMTGSSTAPSISRPVVLDRPFHSVAEMGYAFRDQPWASLDMAPPTSANDSGDTALLDLFSVNDEPTTVAGRVNINCAPLPVVEALLSGATEDDAVGNSKAVSSISALAQSILNLTSTGGAFMSPADLAWTLSQEMQTMGTSYDFGNKACREAPIRAIGSAADTRTWTFLIDVIAQAGRMPATGSTSAGSFIVQGEKHYWIHVSIDRFTGKVIAQATEPVDE
jgi:Tfp pilus assembly protein PilX